MSRLRPLLFLDLHGFTARAAQADPKTIINFLNRFLQAMVEVVEKEHGGMINKFLGDGFMAVFGAGSAATTHADDAVAAGCSMLRRLELFNADLVSANEAPLGIGIGINTGRDCRQHWFVGKDGVHGDRKHRECGSQIEGLNKVLGTSVLLSKATKDQLSRSIRLRALPPQQIKGVDAPVEIFTIAD
jgi:adenylate cyclase